MFVASLIKLNCINKCKYKCGSLGAINIRKESQNRNQNYERIGYSMANSLNNLLFIPTLKASLNLLLLKGVGLLIIQVFVAFVKLNYLLLQLLKHPLVLFKLRSYLLTSV